MNNTMPKLRKRPDGRFVCTWGKKDHYFGRDEAEARRQYAESLRQWSDWREAREVSRVETATAEMPRIIDLAEEFLEMKRVESTCRTYRLYKYQLRRFLHSFGAMFVDSFKPSDLNMLKTEMLKSGLSPKTVNHDIACAKTFLLWAINNEKMRPINLNAVKKLPLAPPPDRSKTIESVRELMALIERRRPELLPIAMVQYLTAARPGEVIQIINGDCDWPILGVARLAVHKTAVRSQAPRHICFSPSALMWLSRCNRRFPNEASYSKAIARLAIPGGTHTLRHSAATHLLESGERREDVETILGHLPARVSLTYGRINWKNLCQTVARLAHIFDGK